MGWNHHLPGDVLNRFSGVSVSVRFRAEEAAAAAAAAQSWRNYNNGGNPAPAAAGERRPWSWHSARAHPAPARVNLLVSGGMYGGLQVLGGGKETYPTPSSLNCETPKAPTLSAAERTWNIDGASPKGDWNEHMPWRAPGSSIPLDACGIASGFDPNAKVQYPHTFAKESNVKQGDKGSELPVGEVTEWEAGVHRDGELDSRRQPRRRLSIPRLPDR